MNFAQWLFLPLSTEQYFYLPTDSVAINHQPEFAQILIIHPR